MMGLLICKYKLFWQEVSVESLILMLVTIKACGPLVNFEWMFCCGWKYWYCSDKQCCPWASGFPLCIIYRNMVWSFLFQIEIFGCLLLVEIQMCMNHFDHMSNMLATCMGMRYSKCITIGKGHFCRNRQHWYTNIRLMRSILDYRGLALRSWKCLRLKSKNFHRLKL